MRLSLFVILGALLALTNCQDSGQKAYHFHTVSQFNWFRANVYCETNNMRLVSIHSLEEHNLLVRKAAELGMGSAVWWIAANDLAQEGVFYWGFRQRTYTYTNWFEGEPNNAGGGEDCTVLGHRHGRNLWNDVPCGNGNYFICEYYVNPPQTGAINSTLDEVDPNNIQY